jgi:hypothetical protein
VTIWKDPVTAMQRTKALGLLHKTVRENAAMCRQGIPDYLITVRDARRAGPARHARRLPGRPVAEGRQPVWMDINPSDTLQYRAPASTTTSATLRRCSSK